MMDIMVSRVFRRNFQMMNAYQFAEFKKMGADNAYLDANPGGSPDDPNGMRPNSWERIPH